MHSPRSGISPVEVPRCTPKPLLTTANPDCVSFYRVPDILSIVSHRPWPLPQGSWLMAQSWNELLFAHWPIPVADLRPLVPAMLHIDTFDGTAWVAVTPFRISGLRARFLPPLPPFSAFPEI